MNNSVDDDYASLLRDLLWNGERVTTRNAAVRRLCVKQYTFRSTPLISARKTAWKNALREWEWFMSGSNRLDDLHPDVRHWWASFCKVDSRTLCYNYGQAFRRIYIPVGGCPITVEPKRMVEDEPLQVPTFPRREVVSGKAKHLGYEGFNCHGDRFRVINGIENGKYLLQFESNGYCVRSSPTNFLSGTVKNPYYPTVLGVGCYGVVDKNRFTYYKRAYRLWSDLMNRCYNRTRRHYPWYGGAGVKVSGRWKCFENFIDDLSRLAGFEEWLLGEGWMYLDKDYNKANYYGPDVCVFLPGRQNIALASAERFYEVPRTELFIDQIRDFVDGIRKHPYSRRHEITTWIPSHVASGLMEPTNCHNTITQAFVGADGLGLYTYQRSVDVVCGLPHNWFQMWAFLLWLGAKTGHKPAWLTWCGGDVHLYEEHAGLAGRIVDMASWCGQTPVLRYSGTADFKADDFSLVGEYRPIVTETAKMVV